MNKKVIQHKINSTGKEFKDKGFKADIREYALR